MTSKRSPSSLLSDEYNQRGQQRRVRRFSLVGLLCLGIVLASGALTFLWGSWGNRGSNQAPGTHLTAAHAAGDVSVVGSPTLSASTVDTIFARVGSPMLGTGKLVETMSRQDNIDDAFALGVWWTETNDGEAGVGLADRNPGSVRGSVGYPSAYDGYTIYPSYSAAIVYWFNMLHTRYVGEGLSTVYSIARPYVGTTSYPLWAGKVIALMYNYRGIAPPPLPPAPRVVAPPKPAINPAIVVYEARQQRIMHLWQAFAATTNTTREPRGQAQEKLVQSSSATQTTAPGLPVPIKAIMVIFGLLAAVAIALYALKLPVAKPQNFVWSSSNEGVCTEKLPAVPTPILVTSLITLPTRSPVTDALPRRVVLLPVTTTDPRLPVPATVGAATRPGGLLSRYGQIS